MRWLSPHGVVVASDWADRFRRIGLRALPAWRVACSERHRTALVSSRLELLPRDLLRELRVVVDVGANEGAWLDTVTALRGVVEAHAFEPNPGAFDRLSGRFGSHRHVHLYRLAIGSGAGTALLNVTGDDVLASLRTPAPALAAMYTESRARIVRQVEVEVAPLDRVLPAGLEVDLLKIDVQGHELEVLAGAAATLSRTTAVLVEMNLRRHYRDEGTFADLLRTLTETHGFVPWALTDPLRGARGEALWCDVCLVREEALATCEAPTVCDGA